MCFGQVQFVDVGGEHSDVVDAALLAACLDMFALWRGVGHRRDARIWKALGHPQGQRSPTATQFQDALAIGEFGTLSVDFQHALFGGIQIRRRHIPVARAVLVTLAKTELEERRRQFVVLRVGGVRFDGDGAAAQLVNSFAQAFKALFDRAGPFLAQALGALLADTMANHRIRNQAAFGERRNKALADWLGCGS